MSAKRALFIFRKDLRLEDNIGLNYALANAMEIVPCFIFDDKQILPNRNPYFGNNLVQFMIESLVDLDEQLKEFDSRLLFFKGEYPDIISKIIREVKPELLCINKDFTPYSRERDQFISDVCKEENVEFQSFEDSSLTDHDQLLSNCKSGHFYKVFTPYYKTASSLKVKASEELENQNLLRRKSPLNVNINRIFLNYT